MEKEPKNTELFNCENCDFKCCKQSEWNRHILRPKHIKLEKNMKKTPKDAKKHACIKCDFVCSKQSDWDRHILRSKHLRMVNEEKNAEHTCFKCSRSYQHNSGLWKHLKTCNIKENIIDIKNDTVTEDKNIIELLIKENSEIKNIVLDMVKSNTELQKQMMDMCKNTSTTHINSHNHSNNKTFNLQFFLNEQCKDAMNISEFVNTFELQLSDLESVGDLGYVEGMTKIIVDKLNGMDVYKRPMHCSDAKRETLYVKDADVWTKEERHNPKLRQAIKNVTFRNMKLVATWSDANPESKDHESKLNDKYMDLVIQSTGGKGNIIDSENKIIRRIAKEIIIGKN
jgi:hypothetical protein